MREEGSKSCADDRSMTELKCPQYKRILMCKKQLNEVIGTKEINIGSIAFITPASLIFHST